MWLRADDCDADAPALDVLRDPQGFADTAAGSQRGREVASRRRSCACSAPGRGRTSDRPQTGRRTDGTAGGALHQRIGHARSNFPDGRAAHDFGIAHRVGHHCNEQIELDADVQRCA